MSAAASEQVSGWSINTPLNLSVERIGWEQTPVIQVDRLLSELDSLCRIARDRAQFSGDGQAGYPGVRATLPADYTRRIMEAMEPVIRSTYDIPPNYCMHCTRQLFSLVTTPENQLKVLQRIPHFDTRRPFYFALMHYLNPGPFGGTGFFRHRPSDCERVPETRYPAFVAGAKTHMAQQGVPPARYCRESNAHFEMIHRTDYRRNRLVIYPGNLLHTGLIEPDRDISDDPATGRLTANIFLDFSPP